MYTYLKVSNYCSSRLERSSLKCDHRHLLSLYSISQQLVCYEIKNWYQCFAKMDILIVRARIANAYSAMEDTRYFLIRQQRGKRLKLVCNRSALRFVKGGEIAM